MGRLNVFLEKNMESGNRRRKSWKHKQRPYLATVLYIRRGCSVCP